MALPFLYLYHLCKIMHLMLARGDSLVHRSVHYYQNKKIVVMTYIQTKILISHSYQIFEYLIRTPFLFLSM